MTDPLDRSVDEIAAVTDAIRPLLYGRPREVQGAILADLLAMWLAGHPSQLRESVLMMHIQAMRPMIAIQERYLFGGRGHPGNAPKQ